MIRLEHLQASHVAQDPMARFTTVFRNALSVCSTAEVPYCIATVREVEHNVIGRRLSQPLGERSEKCFVESAIQEQVSEGTYARALL